MSTLYMDDPELDELRHRRGELLDQIVQLGDFRSGCITALVRRCGKPGCRCSHSDDPGHGPNIRLTYKINGRTHSESLSDPISLKKAQREIAEFRKFQRLSREFVQVNAEICLLLRANPNKGLRRQFRK